MFLTTTITTNNNNNNNNSNNNNNNHSNVLVNAFNNLNLNQLIRFVPNTERVSRFAAHMTCFIWFSDYQQISNNNNNNQNISNCWSSPSSSLLLLSPSSSSLSDIPPGGSHINCRRFNDYKPKDPFRKFCLDVLTTTQISFPAVLLSLLYIHRMKIRNPRIKGQSGSEYRTFTVALMLANKFLDDNTYTNKTWSEVTRIPVSEINTMEIEFLTALQYKLFVSLEQYNDWLQKATRFINYGGDDDTNNTNININNNNNNCNNDNNINHHHHHHYHHHHHHHHQDNNNNHINSNNNNNNIIISQQNHHRNYQILATVIVTPYKRSAQEAFVDDMMISPSKRTNVSRAINNNNNNSLFQFLPLTISSSSSSSNNSNNNNNSYTRTSTINGMATILVN